MLRVAGRLLPHFRLYPWGLPVIVLLGLLASLAEGVGIGLFIPFLDNLDQTAYSASDIWLVNVLGELFANVPPERRLEVISALIFLSILLKAGLSFANRTLFHMLDERIIHRLRTLIVSQLLSVDYRYLVDTETGGLVNTLSNETWRSSEALAELVNFITKASTLIIYGALLLLISWQFTLLVLAVMGLIWWSFRRVAARAAAQGNEATSASNEATIKQIEVVEGMTTIRANSQEPYEQQSFDAASRRAARSIRRVAITREWITPVYEVLAAAFLVFYLYVSLQRGEPIAVALVFLFVLYRLQPLVKTLEESRIHIASLGGAVDAVCDLIDDTRHGGPQPGYKRFAGFRREIRFDRVSFRYRPGSRPALESVSFRLPAGKTVALVGQSGAGKSTLVHLLARFYDPDSGVIAIDDTPLREFDASSWRQRVALVSQETYLFNTSIRNNIAYGRHDAKFEEIEAAARDAEADGFVRELTGGYDAQIGERGLRLSTGQRQRIALARAILRDPDVLILDEATNALDNVSEQAIKKALERARGRLSLLIIAHRLTTVMYADVIVVLENGRVVEQGQFQELVERNGAFKRLYESELRS